MKQTIITLAINALLAACRPNAEQTTEQVTEKVTKTLVDSGVLEIQQ